MKRLVKTLKNIVADTRNIDKIKRTIGPELFDHIKNLDESGLKKQLRELQDELKFIEKHNPIGYSKDPRYNRLKDEEWFLNYRLQK